MRKLWFLGRGVFWIAALGVLGGIVMLLWNAVLPELFIGARQIDYWHALGLLALSRILFGGFRGHGGGWHRHRWHAHHRARWEAMTPEERERFRRGFGWGRRDERKEAV